MTALKSKRMIELTGTRRLVQLAFRLDRVKLTVTVASIGLFVAVLVGGVSEIFASDAEMRQGIAFLAANPAMRLFGLPTGPDMGHLLMLRAFTMISIIVALVSTFTVIRHTRQNEELGRSELVGSTMVGRHAALTSALIVATIVNITIALFVSVGLIDGGLPITGSITMAAAIGLVGFAFSGVAALAAQLTQTSRGANSFAAAAVILGFILSGIGSVLGSLKPSGFAVDAAWPIWFSPIGWAQMLNPFAGENWLMLIVFLAFFFVCVGGAVRLNNKRDNGNSVFAARPGREYAKTDLLGMVGLTWRLQKTAFFGWLVGIGSLAVAFGVIAKDVDDFLLQAEGIAEIFVGATGAEEVMLAFFGSIVSMLGIFVLAYAVSVSLRLRAEEERALGFLLSTGLGRTRWAIAMIGFLFTSAMVLLIVAGFLTGLTADVVTGGSVDMLWQIVVGAFLQLPAIAVLIGVVILTFGVLPKYSGVVAWSIVVVSVALGPMFSSLLNLPAGAANISPLTHTPAVPPADNIAALPLLVLSVVAVGLVSAGIVLFTRRDIAAQ